LLFNGRSQQDFVLGGFAVLKSDSDDLRPALGPKRMRGIVGLGRSSSMTQVHTQFVFNVFTALQACDLLRLLVRFCIQKAQGSAKLNGFMDNECVSRLMFVRRKMLNDISRHQQRLVNATSTRHASGLNRKRRLRRLRGVLPSEEAKKRRQKGGRRRRQREVPARGHRQQVVPPGA
ncbi:Protein of unknown function, partial [Gryllus bimaculatus]